MRKLLIKWLIRQAWHHCKRLEDQEEAYGTMGQRFNMLALLTTSAGGDSSWFPSDVGKDFKTHTEWHHKAQQREEKQLVNWINNNSAPVSEYPFFGSVRYVKTNDLLLEISKVFRLSILGLGIRTTSSDTVITSAQNAIHLNAPNPAKNSR